MARLGGGAFGDVYQAWDPKLAREVALKLLRRRPSAHDVEAVVINEGRQLARVRHPNVVTVFGADRVRRPRRSLDGLHQGADARADRPRNRDRFGADEATLVGVDLCRALAAVHTAGLVHGDIKAQNVMREDGGRIVLMDFGAGRELVRRGDASEDSTGTPIYMAPELFRGAEASRAKRHLQPGRPALSPRHRLISSRRADARRRCEPRTRKANGACCVMRGPNLPAPFIQAVERATSPDPEERFASAGAMEAALARGLDVPVAREPGTSKRLWLAAAAVLATVRERVGVVEHVASAGADGRRGIGPLAGRPAVREHRRCRRGLLQRRHNRAADSTTLQDRLAQGDFAYVDDAIQGDRADAGGDCRRSQGGCAADRIHRQIARSRTTERSGHSGGNWSAAVG